eukprot:GFUD01070378.1.p1 GENE.GFUD01070378.1~~GFUD01070378.1.p1  ORF type:complete len:124 (+),score=30.51 GFUD01070378.1:28-372(+)
MANFLEKPMNKEKLNFLKDFACGFENEVPKICCPVKTINTKVYESTATDEIIDTRVEETTTTDVEATTIGVSDEFDFSLRDGFISEWPEPNYDECVGENCIEENNVPEMKSEFL